MAMLAGAPSRVIAMAAALALTSLAAAAQSVGDFYAGRSMQMVIGAGEGGGFDIAGRLVAEHLSRHLPGKPRIVPQHMPGASGLRAAEFIYSLAPKDGTAIVHTQPSMVLHKILEPSARFEPEKFTWIGRLNSFKTYSVVWHAAPAQTVEQAKSQELVVGALGTSGPSYMLATALNRMSGTKFKIVLGYKSTGEQGIAMERGEIHAIGSTSWEHIDGRRWLQNGQAKLLFTIASERSPYAPGLPTVVELVSGDRDKNAMRLITSAAEVGRAFFAPPGIPVERAQALRDAFERMVKEPDFIAEAKKRAIDIEFLSGADMARMVAGHMTMSADVVARAREVVADKR